MEYKKARELEDIVFENEKAQAMVDCVRTLIAEEVVEIKGVAKDTIDYTLYKAVEMLRNNNARLEALLAAKTE